jgi:hypothetical protein
MTFPTLYEMEPIGVDSALEAVAALHFCSEDCRAAYQAGAGYWRYRDRWVAPIYNEGDEDLSVDGELCECCNKPLEEL